MDSRSRHRLRPFLFLALLLSLVGGGLSQNADGAKPTHLHGR